MKIGGINKREEIMENLFMKITTHWAYSLLRNITFFTPAQAAKGGLIYIGGILSLCGLVYAFYPDKPTLPRTYPGGLDAELGGEGALAVAADVE